MTASLKRLSWKSGRSPRMMIQKPCRFRHCIAGLLLNTLDDSIIFVHGLGGSRSTWTSKTDGILWPKEVLSREFPRTLIMGFVYDSWYRDWLDVKNISRAAENLNTNLLIWLNRRPRSKEVPIAFSTTVSLSYVLTFP